MSQCLSCGKPMSDSEARIYEDCASCRHWARKRGLVRLFSQVRRMDDPFPDTQDNDARRTDGPEEEEVVSHCEGLIRTVAT